MVMLPNRRRGRSYLLAAALLCGWMILLASVANRAAALAPAPAMDLEKSLKKATVDGKYAMLLHQFKDEKDGEEYGEFHDYGYRNKTAHNGQKELMPGYW